MVTDYLEYCKAHDKKSWSYRTPEYSQKLQNKKIAFWK